MVKVVFIFCEAKVMAVKSTTFLAAAGLVGYIFPGLLAPDFKKDSQQHSI